MLAGRTIERLRQECDRELRGLQLQLKAAIAETTRIRSVISAATTAALGELAGAGTAEAALAAMLEELGEI